MDIQITSTGNQAFLGSFSNHMIKCGLFNQNNQELTYIYYARQNISWAYDTENDVIKTTQVSGQNYSARFSVPAGTIKYIGFFNLNDDLTVKIDLQDNAIVYTTADSFDLVELAFDSLIEILGE
jgi:hypothetical protein